MTAEQDVTDRRSIGRALAIFLQRRSLAMLGLGFASGLPYMLIFDTLSVWLRDAGLSLAVIGFFSLATLSFSFKFLWAPLVDRLRLPLLGRMLGQRRSWMLVCQLVTMVGLWLVSGLNPAANLGLMAALAVLVGFSTATHDIAIDAWRIEIGGTEGQGPLAAAVQWGYRVAMVVAGAAPLLLADSLGWNASYAIMAAVMIVGVIATLAAPRETEASLRPVPGAETAQPAALQTLEWAARFALLLLGALLLGSGLSGDASLMSKVAGGEALAEAWSDKQTGVWLQLIGVAAGLAVVALAAWPIPRLRTKPGAYLAEALGAPLAEFLRRHRGVAGLILATICLYRVADFVLNIMNPFYRDLGFSLTEIAEVRKVFGVIASMLGVALGGFLVARLGLMRTLVVGAFAGPLSNLVFIGLAAQGHSIPALFAAIGLDNLAGGVAGTALIVYMSSLTSAGFTATQYAMFTSLYALPGKLIASQSGRLVEWAAHAADAGGPFAGLKALFVRTTPESYVEAAGKLGVTPHALGVGYAAFFFYSTAIGVAAIGLSIAVAVRTSATSSRSRGKDAQVRSRHTT
ncbi:AmpG family muropeptide MFS transporter [Phenylobacterium immobile]|uniref:AmpG family muropeptide MFS transporter n=1 Tax=Phenylobacterium immobile TaxID=21 RepID=UPI000AAE5E92|nr:MFS transporter [Phenylobacterium immobile]